MKIKDWTNRAVILILCFKVSSLTGVYGSDCKYQKNVPIKFDQIFPTKEDSNLYNITWTIPTYSNFSGLNVDFLYSSSNETNKAILKNVTVDFATGWYSLNLTNIPSRINNNITISCHVLNYNCSYQITLYETEFIKNLTITPYTDKRNIVRLNISGETNLDIADIIVLTNDEHCITIRDLNNERIDNIFTVPDTRLNPENELKQTCHYLIKISNHSTTSTQFIYYDLPYCIENHCFCDRKNSPYVLKHYSNDPKEPNVFNITWEVLRTNETIKSKDFFRYGDENPIDALTPDNATWALINLTSVDLKNGTFKLKGWFTNEFDCMYESYLSITIPPKNSVFVIMFIIMGILIAIIGVYNLPSRNGFQRCVNKLRGRQQISLPDIPKLTQPRLNLNMKENIAYTKNPTSDVISPISDGPEISKSQIQIEKEIGAGTFGKVYKGYISLDENGHDKFPVAIKQLRESPTEYDKNSFLAEIELMKKIGKHENVVEFLGCVTQETPCMIIMELVPCGSLKEYLQKVRSEWMNKKSKYTVRNRHFFPDNMEIFPVTESPILSGDDEHELPSPGHASLKPLLTPNLGYSVNFKGVKPVRRRSTSRSCASNVTMSTNLSISPTTPYVESVKPKLSTTELHDFALQIAKGMRYLEEKHITHRDLAARNILITADKALKISDFGMSRFGEYMRTKTGILPLRWMSLEAITQGVSTNKSDVWSYGVVLWEIGTLGGFPYNNIEDPRLVPKLETGYRLSKPEICTNLLYRVMLDCWSESPEERPSFSMLVDKLERENEIYNFNKVPQNYAFPPVTYSTIEHATNNLNSNSDNSDNSETETKED